MSQETVIEVATGVTAGFLWKFSGTVGGEAATTFAKVAESIESPTTFVATMMNEYA